MRDAHRDDLLDTRHEGEAVLRRNELDFILFGDAAYAARVAPRGDGGGAFPPSEKEVARRWALVVQRAVRVVRQEPILRLGLQALPHETLKPSAVETAGPPGAPGLPADSRAH